jgi:hypothetical protein
LNMIAFFQFHARAFLQTGHAQRSAGLGIRGVFPSRTTSNPRPRSRLIAFVRRNRGRAARNLSSCGITYKFGVGRCSV